MSKIRVFDPACGSGNFPVIAYKEIARLALIIAEFQYELLYRGRKEALAEFLPLDSQNWVTCGNASMQMDEALQVRLQVVRGHAGDRDAVVVAELDHRVAVNIGGDQRRQLLNVLDIGEVVELDSVGLRIKVDDGVGADARREYEIVVARPAD